VRREKWARKDAGLFPAECRHFDLSFGRRAGRCIEESKSERPRNAGLVLAELQGDRVSGQQAMEEGAADFLV
jgi:hypothetical protein